ncbi:MAG: cytochrome-c peroxidase [Gemmatimonadetes bacterium]|nr:cytochrome-c peroxidase [Gemmatimonadota bacterium]
MSPALPDELPMTNRTAVLPLVVLATLALIYALTERPPFATEADGHDVPSAAIAVAIDRYRLDLSRADSALGELASLAASHHIAETRAAFLRARRAYKRVEWLAEHYTPLTAAALNGAANDRPDDESPALVVRATGLQVIGAMVYRRDATPEVLDSVALQSRIARVNIRRLRERADESVITSAQLFDAARLELARVQTLGIAGFDAPLAETAIPEAATSLQATFGALTGFARETPAASALREGVRSAVAYLDAHPDFSAFDRFTFIVKFCGPIAIQLSDLQRVAHVPFLTDNRALRANVSSPFDKGAFDPAAFSPPGKRYQSNAIASIGERLFFEKRLSGAGDRSCAMCHRPSDAFTDRQKVPAPLIVTGEARVISPQRNTPTLLNAALQAAAFADARVAFLEDQVAAVIENPREMGGNLEHVALRLGADASYARAFAAAYTTPPGAAVTSSRIRTALAAYMRTLVRLDSRFDRAMRGDETAMTAAERHGFNVFMGKGRCGTCHFVPLFNGTAPPGYSDSEVEVIGVPSSSLRGAPLDTDRGVGALDGSPLHVHAFKTPTVRNVAMTAPYMHNGAFATLEQVIDFYDAGGGAGMGLTVPHQTLAADSLHLTRTEKYDLIAFLGTLTDSTYRKPPR